MIMDRRVLSFITIIINAILILTRIRILILARIRIRIRILITTITTIIVTIITLTVVSTIVTVIIITICVYSLSSDIIMMGFTLFSRGEISFSIFNVRYLRTETNRPREPSGPQIRGCMSGILGSSEFQMRPFSRLEDVATFQL